MKSGPRWVTAAGARLFTRTFPPPGEAARPSSLIGHSRRLSAPHLPRSGDPGGGVEARAAPQRRGGPRTVTQTGLMFSTNSLQRKVFYFGTGERNRLHTANICHYYSFTAPWGAEPGNGHYNTFWKISWRCLSLNLPFCT